MLEEMNESEKIDLIFHAADEIRSVRDQAERDVQSIQRNLVRDLQENCGMTFVEAAYELCMLGFRVNADALEA
jgi:hypothetical protein